MRRLTAALICLAAQSQTQPAPAQPVPNQPIPAQSTTESGLIATAGVFQLALVANPARKGCLVVNKSTAPLMVFLGPAAAATHAGSIILPAGTATRDGGHMRCAIGAGVVVTDTISVASPVAGAPYLVISQ